jgi:serine/threonine protein kinase
MRMPNLGVNISTLKKADKYEPLRKIPIGVLLQQIKKVLEQVNFFIAKDKVHSDIREPNMMVNPKTGAITIIDFDFFDDADKFFRGRNVAFYNRPPENYIYCNYLKRRDYFPAASALLNKAKNNPESFTTTINALDNRLQQLAIETGNRMYDLNLYIKDNNAYLFRKELGLKLDNKNNLIDIIRKNYAHIFKDIIEITDADRNHFEHTMLQYFDGFGLASSLLDLLVATYSKQIFNPKISIAEAVTILKDILEKKVVGAAEPAPAGGAGAAAAVGNVSYEKYTDSELKQIYKVINCIFYLVLLPMISLDITTRITTNEALERINTIIAIFDIPVELNKLYAELNLKIKPALEAIVTKSVANNASSKGGKRRVKTIKLKKRKLRKTCRKSSHK